MRSMTISVLRLVKIKCCCHSRGIVFGFLPLWWLMGKGPGSSQRLLDQEPKSLTWHLAIESKMPAEMISDIENFNYPGGACLQTPTLVGA